MKILIGDLCPACDKLKHHLKEHNIDIETIHEDSREGRDFQREHRVMGKPCLIKLGRLYFGDDIYDNLK